MSRKSWIFAFIAVMVFGQAALAQPAGASTMLWNLNARGGVTPDDVGKVRGFVADELAAVSGRQVIDAASVAAATACGEQDIACATSAGRAAGASRLVYGDLSKSGDTWLLTLFSVDLTPAAQKTRVSSRAWESLDDMDRGLESQVRDVIGVRAAYKTRSGVDPASLTRHRMTVSPTAVGMRKGDFTMTGYGLGVWELQYGLTNHVQLGAVTLLPVGVAGLVPTVQAHWDVHPNLSVGFGAYAGIYGAFAIVDEVGGNFAVVYGGSVQMTAKFGRHFLNFSLIAGSAGLNYEFDDSDSRSFENLRGAYMLPSIGYRFEVHPNWSLQFEVAIPLYAGPDTTMESDQIVTMIFYGVRGHGGLVFGEFGFVIPACEAYFDEIWKYTPLGIPYFALGFAF